ncbi:TOM1-like protein 2 [Oscarella lobularis]|uniref:TOM1-like protein 2 n=1 Tax=Oscarella lobularis TaxID=121494 RepID=UPI003313E5FF
MAFFSSPFSSQVGQRIERATSEQLEAEDWALNMEICDMINETDEGPKDAIKALKKRIFHNKNYRQVMLALSVIETCVKNCGKRFHMHMAHKEFISEFGKLAGPKSNVPMIVKQKILALIQSWSDSFRHQPELANIGMTHEYLRRQGVEFPPQDLDTMAPIYTPERTVPESQAPSASPASRRQEPVQLRHHHETLPQSHEHPPAPSNELTGAASITPTSEQLAKIRSEMDVVRGNVRVLSEMLTALTPGDEETSDWELLRDLNATCRTMQSRLVDLLSRIVSEELTGELLVCNDELNHVFTRYDRFEKNRAAVVQSQSGQTANQAFETPSAFPSTESPSVAAPSLAPGPATGALIDFSAEEPQTTTAPSDAPPPPSYNELHAELGQDLAGLNLGTSTGAPPPPSTNPFANSSAPVASGNDYSEEPGDDFDMFAQSRQSFDTAAQNIGSRTRGYTVEDSHASVAGAMNARSTFPSTEPSGVESMEQWLAATDLQSSKLPENPSDAQDTMTTSEFDKFLEERAIKVTSGGSGLNQSAQARRARPQMQKEESGHEDDLFAL